MGLSRRRRVGYDRVNGKKACKHTMRCIPIIFLMALVPACAGRDVAVAPIAQVTSVTTATDWRRVATIADRKRIGDWRSAFTAALAKARASGHGPAIAREGLLLDPDAAIAGGTLPAGTYRCRVIKLGAQGRGGLDYVAYPSFGCRIADEGEVASFTKLSGSQRPVGLIFDHNAQRRIFLGTLMLGDERAPLDYGRDTTRDMAGAVEQIGPGRWRMILPWPHFESMMDVIELIPESA